MIKGVNMDATLFRLASRQGLIQFYTEQLRRFNKIGLGNYTDFGVKVTPTLFDATQRRLDQLKQKVVDNPTYKDLKDFLNDKD